MNRNNNNNNINNNNFSNVNNGNDYQEILTSTRLIQKKATVNQSDAEKITNSMQRDIQSTSAESNEFINNGPSNKILENSMDNDHFQSINQEDSSKNAKSSTREFSSVFSSRPLLQPIDAQRIFLYNFTDDEKSLISCATPKYNFEYSFDIYVGENDLFRKCIDVIASCKKLDFSILIDICACDYPSRDKRFAVYYEFLSISNNIRTRVSIDVREDEEINTVSDLYKSADWLEREVYDLFGIKFKNHRDMRRILTDYGFVGHPLRKDFPVYGNVEVYYDSEGSQVKYKNVELEQPYREMNFESPWKGTKYNLPGDEKAL